MKSQESSREKICMFAKHINEFMIKPKKPTKLMAFKKLFNLCYRLLLSIVIKEVD
jgi:hypothetical protein